ncbi:urease accessory protein UreF [Arthrobacter sp. 35W]|uniref:urease accessory protein UreF n=1 Tax=Arthrobacter sp. 35W TaxID=1132441 RepID=UPI0003F54EA7|nr:urease accessory protein UreF [Arthrobacter sp. 35W]
MEQTPAGPPSYLLALLQLSDSALPTGAFSHSFGMEMYLERGLITNEADFARWLGEFVAIQLVHNDGLAIRLALEAGPVEDVFRLDAMLAAAALPREIREAGTKMGLRMLDIARQVAPGPELDEYAVRVADGRCAGHPAIAVGLVGRALSIPAPELVAAYLFSTVTSLTQNAIRAIPIGQNAGQRVLRGAHSVVGEAVAAIAALDESEFGAAAPGLEIAQMRHERQRARIFMS